MRRIGSVRQYRLKALGKAEPKSAASSCNLSLITGLLQTQCCRCV